MIPCVAVVPDRESRKISLARPFFKYAAENIKNPPITRRNVERIWAIPLAESLRKLEANPKMKKLRL